MNSDFSSSVFPSSVIPHPTPLPSCEQSRAIWKFCSFCLYAICFQASKNRFLSVSYHLSGICSLRVALRGDVKEETYREEATDELRDAGECRSVAFVLRQTTAQKSEPALPHLDGERARRGKELSSPAALQVSHSQGLHGSSWRPRVAQWVKDKYYTQSREEQDDPTIWGGNPYSTSLKTQ